ncbi:MAG TPA: alpha/beta fold hydrolase [Aestuariivirga sp.]|nr:alpha/beta fold hydrolase [Aestuariivirga sp.]
MSGSSELKINEPLYQWCVRGFTLLRRRVGMNIAVHAEDGLIENGQIFQFNHFARFETIIPQYFIYQATGAYCRCVAMHELFEGNDRFAKLLWGVGAVPNNHPGLLAFLAAEILRGRKVIFFPEGLLNKDRRIATAPASPFLATLLPRTAHHNGSAALAVVLEIFKKRILSVHEAGDMQRLGRWVAALGLADQTALIAAARKPSLIVPANITFHPIHTGDNILRKAAEFFSRKLGEKAKGELLIEGNLLLRDTDMDIRFGRPFHPGVAWSLADRVVISRIFEQIDSLDELFGLKTTASRWIERMAALTMRRTTRRLRDLCMAEMYARVTVNLSHLASLLVMRFLEAGETEIERSRFNGLLYAIVKQVQQQPGLHLHRTLTNPEAYDGVRNGTSQPLEQFFETAAASSLMDITGSHYRLLPALRGGNGGRDPRLENVIRVYANEIAALDGVTKIVEHAVPAEGAALARLLFDDELRSFVKCKEKFSGPRYAAVNSLETASQTGEPYFIVPERRLKPGVVLVHGLLASPAELKGLGQRLADLGHPVLGVRLKGHGTSPWDLQRCTWQDWLASVRRGYEIMSHLTDEVLIVGFATGASLALQLAARHPPGLVGVVAVSAPLGFQPRSVAFAIFMHGLNKLSEWVYVQEGLKPFHARDPEHPDIDYRNMPVRSLVELRKAADELDRRLPQVACPVTIIQGTDDQIVDPASAQLIHARIGSAEKSLHMIPSQHHGILHEDIAGTQALVVSLLGAMAVPLTRATPPRAAILSRIGSAMTGVFAPLLRRYGKAPAG